MKKDESVGEADAVAEGRAVVESTSPVVKATVSEVGEVTETLIDKAPVLVDTAQSLEEPPTVAEEKAAEVLEEAKTSKKTKDQSQVSTSSLSDLKDAIESLGMARTEEESLKEIKEELEDYDEDVKELDEIKNLVDRLDLNESKAAKRLFSRVNKMLNRTDHMLESLKKKEKQIQTEIKEMGDSNDEQQKEKIVTIQELIEAVSRLQKTPNQARVDQIAQVTVK